MSPKVFLAVSCSLLVLLPSPSHAENACGAVGFEPTTSGFALNPILDKLTVTYARPAKVGDVCLLQGKDVILKVNQQVVPGARALKVMRYWKSIKGGSIVTYTVNRNGTTLTLTSK